MLAQLRLDFELQKVFLLTAFGDYVLNKHSRNTMEAVGAQVLIRWGRSLHA